MLFYMPLTGYDDGKNEQYGGGNQECDVHFQYICAIDTPQRLHSACI